VGSGKVLGEKKPKWDEEIPEHLWTAGTGQCTSFAIATNSRSGMEATYSEYSAAHRLASKVGTDNVVLVIDSGRLHAFEIAENEIIAKWENKSGKVHYQINKEMIIPQEVKDHHEAMKLCFDQLFAKGGTLY